MIFLHLDTFNMWQINEIIHVNEKTISGNLFVFFFFFFFWFGFYGPFKNISLISSRSFIKGGRKPENPEKNHLTIRKQNLAFPHMTRARLEPQRWETQWIKSQLSYPLGYGGPRKFVCSILILNRFFYEIMVWKYVNSEHKYYTFSFMIRAIFNSRT